MCSYVHNFCVNHVHEIWLTGYPYRLNNLGDLDPQYNFTATSPDANEGRRARRMDLVYPFDPSYYADAGVHPYHQHTYPFQVCIYVDLDDMSDLRQLHCFPHLPSQVMKVMDTPYVPYDFIRPGEWRDTVVELLNGTVVRTRPTDFGGEVSSKWKKEFSENEREIVTCCLFPSDSP